MIPMKAFWHRQSGFRDVQHEPQEVTVVGFLWGKYDDYHRGGVEQALAIVQQDGRALFTVPISQIHLATTEGRV